MYLLNLGYRWTLTSGLDNLDGVVVLPAHNLSARLEREPPSGEFKRLLFDPQMYLSSLAAEGRTKACARLASYPWFDVPDVEGFDPDSIGMREWEAGIRNRVVVAWPGGPPADLSLAALLAIDFQAQMGCTHIILPAPLVTEREDEGGSTGEWLDAGIEAGRELDIPQSLLATVAISEATLNESAFASGGLLEAVADHVTSRGDELDGVYIVVAYAHGRTHPFDVRDEVTRAYAHLAGSFAQAGLAEVVTNFGDLAGILACGTGASGFAVGPSLALRTLNIEEFQDEGGGIALPQYYSHKVAGEFLSEADLDLLVQKQAFRRIADRTSFSEPLVDHLLAGGSARDLPSWAESQNNYRAAHQHFVQRLLNEGRRLRRARTATDRRDIVLDWLEEAEANALFVDERMEEGVAAPGRRAPTRRWAELLRSLGGTAREADRQ